MTEVQNNQLEKRLQTLNNWILDTLLRGQARYDRSGVLDKEHTQIREEGGKTIVTLPHYETVRDLIEEFELSGLQGTCREVSQFVAYKLLEDGIVDDTKVYACATQAEAHYVVIAEM